MNATTAPTSKRAIPVYRSDTGWYATPEAAQQSLMFGTHRRKGVESFTPLGKAAARRRDHRRAVTVSVPGRDR